MHHSVLTKSIAVLIKPVQMKQTATVPCTLVPAQIENNENIFGRTEKTSDGSPIKSVVQDGKEKATIENKENIFGGTKLHLVKRAAAAASLQEESGQRVTPSIWLERKALEPALRCFWRATSPVNIATMDGRLP